MHEDPIGYPVEPWAVREVGFSLGSMARFESLFALANGHIGLRGNRLVSFAYRSIAAIAYDVRPVDGAAQVVVQSELVANEQIPVPSDDPRAAAMLSEPLESEQHNTEDARGLLVHRTKRSGLRVGAGMDHVIEGPDNMHVDRHHYPDSVRITVTAALDAGQPLRIVKFLAYGWSSERSLPAIRAQGDAALTAARAMGWRGLLASQRTYLDEFWSRADVEVYGDDEVQQAVRF